MLGKKGCLLTTFDLMFFKELLNLSRLLDPGIQLRFLDEELIALIVAFSTGITHQQHSAQQIVELRFMM